MRLYPIHVFVKDVSIFLIFFLLLKIEAFNKTEDFFGYISWSEAVAASFYFGISLTIIDLILQTIIYYGFKSRIRIKELNKYLIGSLLHIPALILWLTNIEIRDSWISSILAVILSTMISAVIYYSLNKELKNKYKAEVT